MPRPLPVWQGGHVIHLCLKSPFYASLWQFTVQYRWSGRPKLCTDQVESLGHLWPWNGDSLKNSKKNRVLHDWSLFSYPTTIIATRQHCVKKSRFLLMGRLYWELLVSVQWVIPIQFIILFSKSAEDEPKALAFDLVMNGLVSEVKSLVMYFWIGS